MISWHDRGLVLASEVVPIGDWVGMHIESVDQVI